MGKGVTRWMFYLYLIFESLLNLKHVAYIHLCAHIYIHIDTVSTVKEQIVRDSWVDCFFNFSLKA